MRPIWICEINVNVTRQTYVNIAHQTYVNMWQQCEYCLWDQCICKNKVNISYETYVSMRLMWILPMRHMWTYETNMNMSMRPVMWICETNVNIDTCVNPWNQCEYCLWDLGKSVIPMWILPMRSMGIWTTEGVHTVNWTTYWNVLNIEMKSYIEMRLTNF